MGRRALPKIDPAIDVSRHLFLVGELPERFDLTPFVARPEMPLEVEVGSGKGLFMASASRAYPEHNFLGVEISGKYAKFAASRLAKEQRGNAAMLHGDAQIVFGRWLPDQSCAAVHVYFPDPWWKKRHHKRRIMSPSFVKQIERVLMPGGSLHFWTDVEEYFHMALATLAEHTSLAGPLAVPELPAEHDLDYRTHFERRMRLHELAVWRAEFRKNSYQL
jgi:tRNA (guanine-N7-)-methyltransferase